MTVTTSKLVKMAVDTEFVWEQIAPMLRGATEPIKWDDDVEGFLGGFEQRGSQTIRAQGDTRRLAPHLNSTRWGTGKSAFDLGVLGEQLHMRELKASGLARAAESSQTIDPAHS